jgi:CRP-like cAMP-binding protein
MAPLFGAFGSDREEEAQKKRIVVAAPSLRTMSRRSRDALLQIARVCRLIRRERLVVQGEHANSLYVLGNGRVRIEREVADGTVHLFHCGAGHVVGPLDLHRPSPATESAYVVEESLALRIRLDELRELALRDGAVTRAMTAIVGERLRFAEQRLESLLLHDVETRIAAFLLFMVDHWGAPSPDGVTITTSLRHHEIASMVGTGREWVTVTLVGLRRRRIIGASGRRFMVRNVDALRAIAHR